MKRLLSSWPYGVGVLLACLVVGGQAARFVSSEQPALSLLIWAGLAASGAALALAIVVLLGRLESSPAEMPVDEKESAAGLLSARSLAMLWCVITLAGVLAWPIGVSADKAPLAALVFYGSLLAIPLLWAEIADKKSSWRRFAPAYRLWLTIFGLAIATTASIVYFLAARPTIGGVDMFYYVCYARDMLHGPGEVSNSCYHYFPGVYAFWRMALRFSDGSEAGLQWSYLALLSAQILVVAGIVYRMTRRIDAAVFAGVWLGVLFSRFQGFAGTTEPLATLPFTAALLIWGGQPLRGRRGVWRCLALGAGFGLALFAKQQGGLLALGAAALLINRFWASKKDRHSLVLLIALPVVSVVVFLSAMLLEGKGLAPLLPGGEMLVRYEAEESWLYNLYVQVRGDEIAAFAAALVMAAWLGILCNSKLRGWAGQRWFEVASLAAISGLATLLQFTSRAYHHYALLAMPSLVIAATLLAVHLLPRILGGGEKNELVRFTIVLLAALPLVFHDHLEASLHVWRLKTPESFTAQKLWHRQPQIAADLQALKHNIQPGEIMFILPPRHNSVHFILGTRADRQRGYSFRNSNLPEISWEQYDAVLVISDGLDESDRKFWTSDLYESVLEVIGQEGFEPQVRLPTMTLYRPGEK